MTIAALLVIIEEEEANNRNIAMQNIMAAGSVPNPETPGLTLPQVVSATLLVDLPADDLEISLLSTFPDTSGNSHDFSAIGDARPDVQTIDDNKVVVFDPLDNDVMDGGNILDNLQSYAVFTVFRHVDTFPYFFYKLNLDTYDGWFVGIKQIYLQQDADNWINVGNDIALTSGVKYVQTMEVISPTVIHAYVNGENADETQASSGTVTNYSNSETVKLGTIPDNPEAVQFLRHMVYQITDLDNWEADRVAITAWLAARYGVTL